jgi:predicted component of type VI protein secretion system
MAWKLRIRDHKSNTASHEQLDLATVQVGRDPNCDIVLDNERVSRRHVELKIDEAGAITVANLSSNGTFLRVRDEWATGWKKIFSERKASRSFRAGL